MPNNHHPILDILISVGNDTHNMIIYNNIQDTGYVLKMFGRIIDIPSLHWLKDILRTSTNLVVESPKIIEYFSQSSLHIRIKINQCMLNLTGMINEIIADVLLKLKIKNF